MVLDGYIVSWVLVFGGQGNVSLSHKSAAKYDFMTMMMMKMLAMMLI